MKTKSAEFRAIASRPARRTVPGHVSSPLGHAEPAAFDEIFANLALKQEQVELVNSAGWNSERIRETASEMERQRGRLAQLLRDIDLSA